MSAPPEVSLLPALLVDLVHGLRQSHDIASVLKDVVVQVGVALHADEVGILLADDTQALRLLASSSTDANDLEVLQLAADDGPCVHVYDTGAPIILDTLADAAERWPRWTAAAGRIGFASALAVPLSTGGVQLGAINLLGRRPGMFGEPELRVAEVLTDVITVLLLAQGRQQAADRLTSQLQQALDSRILIEQAKGALSERNGISTTEAFNLIRSAARNRGMKLHTAAAAVLRFG